jgi:hypothetical protein
LRLCKGRRSVAGGRWGEISPCMRRGCSKMSFFDGLHSDVFRYKIQLTWETNIRVLETYPANLWCAVVPCRYRFAQSAGISSNVGFCYACSSHVLATAATTSRNRRTRPVERSSAKWRLNLQVASWKIDCIHSSWGQESGASLQTP